MDQKRHLVMRGFLDSNLRSDLGFKSCAHAVTIVKSVLHTHADRCPKT
jgi:hypothetical protein